ncbi:dodecin domain-containing protein [Nafulsella turpanensis]|uniref:dodecin domain-containing protein n=1 Tax=Nafulsella turpanensis TaxID=1265690 RepID=UPI00034CB2F0|nr:dodecin domain-containing protein [Nafulsella turpanensis]
MRQTKLVASSEKSISDAVQKIISKAVSFSENIKSLHIIEDSQIPATEGKFHLRGHVRKRI